MRLTNERSDMSTTFRRILPEPTALTAAFWTGGQHGQLRILRCQACQRYIHPPLPICPGCLSRQSHAVSVAGTGTIASFTINHQSWFPGLEVPFAVAIVELDEQPGLRLTTNIIGQPLDEIAIGQRVKVVFEQHDDVWLPMFTPLA
jgi:uncharacterized protein